MLRHPNLIHVRSMAVNVPSFKGKATATLIELGQKWKDKTTKGVMLPTEPDMKARKKRKLDRDQESMYVLSMFPYPSGMLHMGHLRVYTISDALNRFFKQRGYSVIHPMGWDAFGLPAENAAIERHIHPSIWTKENIVKMREQMNNMLANFDWDREVTTCNPDYYKFNQWIFLKLYENGLAYRKEAEINWDPVDKTVLANEQVDANGRSWRSGAKVEKRLLKQWFLGITKFADNLNSDLRRLKKWPEKVKTMQKNWIGKSKGVQLLFGTDNSNFDEISAFTTRVETLPVAQFLALSKDHPIATHYAKIDPKLRKFIENISNLPPDSKDGYLISEIKAINPLTQDTIPIFVTPYVISDYGNDSKRIIKGAAVMGCPAHDTRDFEFWKQNMPNEMIKSCLEPEFMSEGNNGIQLPFTDTYAVRMTEDMGKYSGLNILDARNEIRKELQEKKVGSLTTKYRLRDWLISRQRYWGTPIPMIHCDDCGTVPVPEKDLPVVLPDIKHLSSKGGSPLSQVPEFVNVKCPSCGNDAKRETDTMDTFMDSSWYFFRYLDPKNKDLPFGPSLVSKNMPVDIYVGGVEHAILHLLYSRFISKFLGSIGMWSDEKHSYEPFKHLLTQGMVKGETLTDPDTGRYLKKEELHVDPETGETIITATGKDPVVTYEKMSKSKYNGADPNECISTHGPDATRAHIMFQSPVEDALVWDESKIIGIERWLIRVLRYTIILAQKQKFDPNFVTPEDMTDPEIEFHNKAQKLIKSITEEYDINLSLNTVISDYMKFTNILEVAADKGNVRNEILMQNLQKLIIMLYPVTPSISEETADIIKKNQEGWEGWNHYRWPRIERIVETKFQRFQIVVNGRVKFYFTTEKNFFKKGRDYVIETLMNSPDGRKYLSDKTIKKFVMKYNIVSFQFHKNKNILETVRKQFEDD
ncbi:leucine--tRNA ligase NAM2 NDAI_0J02170 [Naumovozyma dairenensis CBS 421]|uniref:leucine--tRNA ligase n=1 Tax=Naumovozyma dairenensis (strain ATCC 10597 / BCRC 20456 / CBS 421 / NBRC 0211 / NRRL Y-12639) TaxID=1071378 RepID=G0WH31_NAUDC|nr:hypothetical protein NDAI_0J02170 [Naumovozyma dairenensis CBS 421]CCD27109.1 hypothetical protein NDAI_0J02170 [Naumovozyma dairenensis CBS 421]